MEPVDAEPTVATASSTTANSAFSLSEAWEVEARHVGCYTGGKIMFSQPKGLLCCLCDEEMCLVDVDGATAMQRAAQEGDGAITFAIDPKGETACTSHRSGLVRHWKVSIGSSPTLLRAWRAHDQLVSDTCFDATGAFIATGSVDRCVKVFDAEGYFCTHNFRGHTSLVTIVRFHPSQLRLVSTAEAELRVWDLQSSQCIAVLKDHLSSISSLAFGKVKKGVHQLLTAGRDQVLNVWSLADKPSLVRSIPCFEVLEGVAAVSLASLNGSASPDWLSAIGTSAAYIIFTVGGKGVLKAWSPATGKLLHQVVSPHAAQGTLRHVLSAEGPSEARLLTAGEDMNIAIWSLPDFCIVNFVMGHNDEISHVQFLPTYQKTKDPNDGEKEVLTATAAKFVCITNDEHPKIITCKDFRSTLLMGHTDIVVACDVSVDGKWIATGGKDNCIWVWSAETGQGVCRLTGHAGTVSALSFPKKRLNLKSLSRLAAASANMPLTLVSGSQDKTMKIWEVPHPSEGQDEAAEVQRSKVTVIAHAKEVNDVCVAPNNKMVASAGQDKVVMIWGFPKGGKLGELKGHRRPVWNVAFSPVDQVIASASGDGTVRLWSLKDFSPIKAFQGHSGPVLRVCFMANGMQIMSSSADGLVKLWQLRTADCVGTFEEHTGKVWCIDVIGDCMVSGGTDSKLCIWRDVTAKRAKERHQSHAEEVLKDSKIGTLLQQGKVEGALTLALDLGRPGQMRSILVDHGMGLVSGQLLSESAPGTEEPNGQSKISSESRGVDLHRWVQKLSAEQQAKLMELLEQWNSNRKTAPLAQMLMRLVLAVLKPESLAVVEGMNATCTAILSYSSRHMVRVESLLQKTFLFDLVLQSSGQGLATLQDDLRIGPSSLWQVNGDGDSLAGRMQQTKGDKQKGAASAERALKRTMDVLLGDSGEDDAEEEEETHADGGGAPEEPTEAVTVRSSSHLAVDAGARPPSKKKKRRDIRAAKVAKHGS